MSGAKDRAMTMLLVGLGIIALTGFLALASGRSPKAASTIGPAGAIVGSILALLPAVQVLISGQPVSASFGWQMPLGAISVELDALSALFLVPILFLSAICALYGRGYLKGHDEHKAGAAWFCFNLLAVSMAGVVMARNALLFLMAWEMMSLSSFFLVAYDSEIKNVRRAAWIYLIATHLGTAFVLAFFLILGASAGSFEFSTFAGAAVPPSMAGMLFVFAVIGFGTKAGILPLHVWLPEAHPAAPSHVSALMSGVMIKTGIYGILRAFTFLGTPPAWWGWMLVIAGLASGLFGILFALTQRDLKRLLAYSSVENVGIIMAGLGLGLIGVNASSPLLTALGFGGALLHIVNHALFKGLLFMGAGSIQHGSGTRDIERLGGLLKRMPITGGCFMVGAIAICGIPPLNGFVSEFAIYRAGFIQTFTPGNVSPWAGVAVIAALAMIGGLAIACFTKAFSMIFLGAPKFEESTHAHESSAAMTIPMLIAAAACALIGLFAPTVLAALAPAVCQLSGMDASILAPGMFEAARPMQTAVIVFAILIGAVLLLALVRKMLLSGRTVAKGLTWDCGYSRPASRMQYTASSFAQPLVDLFSRGIGVQRRIVPPSGLLPSNSATFHTERADTFLSQMFVPLFRVIGDGMKRVRPFQHGHLQLYVLYLALTLLVLLIWHLGGGQ